MFIYLASLFKRLRKLKNPFGKSQNGRTTDSFQRQLNGFQAPPQEKRRPPIREVSIGQIENEANDELKSFKSHVKQVKNISLKMNELIKMLKSGEISENVYEIIMVELGEHLSLSIEEIFMLREMLEISRGKAKLEWIKEKIRWKELETLRAQLGEWRPGDGQQSKSSTSLYRVEQIISNIDATSSSLTIEEETSIIEQYLSFIKDFSQKTGSEEIKKGLMASQQRLNSISERWTPIRRSKIEQIINLELEASKLKEEIKEVEVRFAVGELNQTTYESKVSILQGNLKKVEKETSDIRNFIDDVDMKIFRCAELLREKL